MQVDEQLLDHTGPDELYQLYAQYHQKELRLFEELTEELYGEPRKPWEIYDDMITLEKLQGVYESQAGASS